MHQFVILQIYGRWRAEKNEEVLVYIFYYGEDAVRVRPVVTMLINISTDNVETENGGAGPKNES